MLVAREAKPIDLADNLDQDGPDNLQKATINDKRND